MQSFGDLMKIHKHTTFGHLAIDKLVKLLMQLSMATIVFTLQACSKENNHSTVDKDNTSSRIILAYIAGENDLSADATADLDEMLKGCVYMSKNDTLIVFMDNCKKTKLPCIYEITNGMNNKNVNELIPFYTFDEDVNSASSEILEQVMSIMYKKYHADSYGIIFWSHGSGWIPSNYELDNNSKSKYSIDQLDNQRILFSFGVDTGDNSFKSLGYQINIPDMAKVLSKFPKTEFIMFDACFMQSIEVAYELGKYTNYIIASPAEIPAWGAPYQDLAKPLYADTFRPSEVIDTYHSYYKEYHSQYGILLSVVDCKHLESFASKHRLMIDKYKEQINSIDLTDVLNYFIFDKWNNPDMKGQYNQSDCPDYYDIRGVMQRVITDNADYNAWEEELNKVVAHSCKNDTWFSGYPKSSHERFMPVIPEQFSGLTIYVEQDKYKEHFFYDAYQHTAWAKAIYYGE